MIIVPEFSGGRKDGPQSQQMVVLKSTEELSFLSMSGWDFWEPQMMIQIEWDAFPRSSDKSLFIKAMSQGLEV